MLSVSNDPSLCFNTNIVLNVLMKYVKYFNNDTRKDLFKTYVQRKCSDSTAHKY